MNNQSNSTLKTLLVILPIALFLFVTVYFVKNQNSQQNVSTEVNPPIEYSDTAYVADTLPSNIKNNSPKDTKRTILGVWIEREDATHKNIWKLIKTDKDYHIFFSGLNKEYICKKHTIKKESEFSFHSPDYFPKNNGYFHLRKGSEIFICKNFEDGFHQDGTMYSVTLILRLLPNGEAYIYLDDIHQNIFEEYSYLYIAK